MKWKVRLSDLWGFSGSIDRAPYVIWGIGLALIKYNLDRFVLERITGERWSYLSYYIPGDAFGLLRGSNTHPVVLRTLADLFFFA